MINALKNHGLRVMSLIAVSLTMGAMAFAPLAHAATGCIAHSYSSGDSGHCVKDIQGMLNIEGSYLSGSSTGAYHYSHLTVDGNFGSLTTGQVKVFQDWFQLSVDGQVGAHTWSNLCSFGSFLTSNNNLSASDTKTLKGYMTDASC